MERELNVLANYMLRKLWGRKGVASGTVMVTPRGMNNGTKKCKGGVKRVYSTHKKTATEDTEQRKIKNGVCMCPVDGKGKKAERVPNIEDGRKPNEQERGALCAGCAMMKSKGRERLRSGGCREYQEGSTRMKVFTKKRDGSRSPQ